MRANPRKNELIRFRHVSGKMTVSVHENKKNPRSSRFMLVMVEGRGRGVSLHGTVDDARDYGLKFMRRNDWCSANIPPFTRYDR